MIYLESICTKCGAVFESDDRYCGFDGSELVCCEVDSKPLPNNKTLRRCPKCTKWFPQYAKFCGNCGTNLEIDNTVPQGVPKTSFNEAPDFRQPTATVSQSQKAIDAGQSLLREEDENAPILTGEILDDKYRIDKVLAEGGMATLYLSHQINIDRTVIVKVMHTALMHRKDAIERFKRESKLVARLQHPNIVAVYDFGFKNGKQPYMVMEYIRGGSLGEKLEKGVLDLPTSVRIMLQICAGLEEAHSTGIIHRDLKPDNILLQEKSDRPDWVKIVDFGIAHLVDNPGKNRLTRVGVVIGTPEYMAPEQFTGKTADARTDIYALGLIFFETLVGSVPFQSDSYELLMARRLMEEAPSVSGIRQDLPRAELVDAIIAKCLAHEQANRYQTVAELNEALQQLSRELN